MPITPRKTEGKQGKDALQTYRAKRDFRATPEPEGGSDAGALASSFVVQKHWASSLHFDFRLELDGTLKSWAVPKGPSLDPAVKRMAVQVEDHPIAYAGFEGTIPTGQYGAGKVIVWDSGHWRAIGDAREGYRAGHLKFELHGHKLQGRWVLVRMKGKGEKQAPWLLIKEKDGFVRAADEFSVVDALPGSVLALGPAQGGPSSVLPALPSEAVLTPLPLSLSPQLATLALAAPLDAENWLLEIKFDGYRMLARIDDATVRLFTRNGHDWSDKLPALKRELLRLALPAGWYDGEIVMLNEAGVPDFGALQRSFEAGTTGALLYYLFDLPYGHGHDLRALPLHVRRALLEQLLGEVESEAVRLSAVFDGSTASVLSSACQLGLEGVIAKRRDGKYSGSRSRDWLKLKCGQAQSFVVGGYTEPQGARAGFGALLLGKYDAQGELHYAGKVGSGFSDGALRDILQQLAADARETCPFSRPLKIEGRPHWVEPLWFAEVSFSEWTQGGRVRHAVFRSLRKDSKARSTMREQALVGAASPRQADVLPAALKGLRVTHPERVIDVSTGTTKMDLLCYYAQVGALMLKHLKGRPVALARAPEGVDGSLFFQKHADTGRLEGVRQLDPKLDPEHPALIEVGSARGLLSAAQWNVIEFHTMNTGTATLEELDRLVFDLDPGSGVAWEQVQEAAELTRNFLAALGLPAFLKTSGGKGLHIVVPIRKGHDWAIAKGFAQAIVAHMANTIPKRFVAKSGPKHRVGRIFIDYLRNGRGATTVCAWSARARPGLGISVPVAWHELNTLRGGDHWRISSVEQRLAIGNQPWQGYARAARGLRAPMQALGYEAKP